MTEKSTDNTTEEYAVCPHCKQSQTVKPVTAVYRDSEAQNAIFKGSLNRFTCRACGAEFAVQVPILYRDDDARMFIYYVPAEQRKGWQEAEKQMDKILENVFDNKAETELPDCRLTLTYRGFIEKTSLHLAGLDDRLIEYLKYQLYKDPQRKLDPVRIEMLYDFSKSEGSQIYFLLFDRETGQSNSGIHIPMELYTELKESVTKDEDMKNEIREMFKGYFINVETLLGLC